VLLDYPLCISDTYVVNIVRNLSGLAGYF
jgi:hypothetical protein